MKINITKNEFRLLLDILAITYWVMNAYKTNDDPRTVPYKTLEQKFLSYAKDFGFEDLIVYDEKIGKYFPSIQYEISCTDRVFIDEFEEEVFLDKLCGYLAERDLIDENCTGQNPSLR